MGGLTRFYKHCAIAGAMDANLYQTLELISDIGMSNHTQMYSRTPYKTSPSYVAHKKIWFFESYNTKEVCQFYECRLNDKGKVQQFLSIVCEARINDRLMGDFKDARYFPDHISLPSFDDFVWLDDLIVFENPLILKR
jgi:hypothetical protein